jgi:hypothetical protein
LGSHEAVSKGRRSMGFSDSLHLFHLTRNLQLPYHDTLSNFPFKGEETALRSMEHAELITITTHNGRPSTIRPGKPVYKWVFERVVGGSLVDPPIVFSGRFAATDRFSVH